ncbi:type VI secretion system-associated FHA domain protein TagH [Pseudomonas sp. RGM2987]|uniref:type VI secretion system-associated FHA domain protein TagH n=1 Tax=Pseudomonas sp. RGM2987 TaxID=2930090 RepID=UPI001FD638E4|nr:type VI secretion system-associated FHA domain protein TagH [Pseudomonas sp. RGM2987]MCJ8205745.1 type VI secretion system-associated FHA domain protein TagH [Pseudomonas sp. RGM2987]
MELVFEVLNTRQFIAAQLCQKAFGPAGGVIGRGEDCDWVIPDRRRLLSKRHAVVSYREEAFFLTDTSGNGTTHRASGARLAKGEPVRIQDGDAYIMGDVEVLARLVPGEGSSMAATGRSTLMGNLIPDDVFLDLDPLKALDQQERASRDIDELISPTAVSPDALGRSDYARIDLESLLLPELVEAPVESGPEPIPPAAVVDHPRDAFWKRFGAALGLDLENLDGDAREALAISAAQLLKQSVHGLQQGLRTQSVLKNELRLSQFPIHDEQRSPLQCTDDTRPALKKLLLPDTPSLLPADQVIARAYRDLQAHQVALLSASRATLRATLEHFSPRQLILRMAREHKPLITTSGHYWKAYGRYHQDLCQDDDWTERVLARDFSRAYEEQVRLVSSLQTEYHG